MTSSFAAQNRGSYNAHQNPVKSHKGGYLRCPFNISGTYAALAEKRVKEDLARGSSARGGGTAVADKDGLLTSASAGSHSDANDGPEGSEGRPWSRAGVGAAKLSGKEKRTQQEQAELIYGRGSPADGEGEESTSHSGGGSGNGMSQEHMFAVDTRDQSALQQVVPRAVREKVKRRRFEELKQGRTQLGHHTPHHNRVERSGGDETVAESGETREVEPQASKSVPSSGRSALSSAATNLTGPSLPSSNSTSNGGPSYSSSPRAAPPTSSVSQREPTKPMNRMQMLDALRSSALTGKKRKR